MAKPRHEARRRKKDEQRTYELFQVSTFALNSEMATFSSGSMPKSTER